MKHRLQTLRKVARLSHDERIIELVTQTADQIEEDIGPRLVAMVRNIEGALGIH